MATDPGDLVLDPTCGSGTTAFVAEEWGRRWITIDTSRVALTLARQRIMGARVPVLREGRQRRGSDSGGATAHEDGGRSSSRFRVPEGAARHTAIDRQQPRHPRGNDAGREIDAAIRRHADFELLYERPEEDRSRVRVSGPFTVESALPTEVSRLETPTIYEPVDQTRTRRRSNSQSSRTCAHAASRMAAAPSDWYSTPLTGIRVRTCKQSVFRGESGWAGCYRVGAPVRHRVGSLHKARRAL